MAAPTCAYRGGRRAGSEYAVAAAPEQGDPDRWAQRSSCMSVETPLHAPKTGRPPRMIQGMDDPDALIHGRLIEAIALDRDRDAFARLFLHFAPRLKAWLIRSGATPGAAEDFAQDAMLTV